MDGQNFFLAILLGLASGSHEWNVGSTLKVTFRPGDNVTLHCDCKSSSGAFIVWFRNCSHKNQPSLVLRTQYKYHDSYLALDDFSLLSPFPRIHLVHNKSSSSYDLSILNISESDEGLYYCGTEQQNIKTETKNVFSYGNVSIGILINSSHPHGDVGQSEPDCSSCLKLLFSLCPTLAVLCAVLSSLLVYQHAQHKAERLQNVRTSRQNREKQDEDVCYAAVGIHQASKRPKLKSDECSDCTYSAINTATGHRANMTVQTTASNERRIHSIDFAF